MRFLINLEIIKCQQFQSFEFCGRVVRLVVGFEVNCPLVVPGPIGEVPSMAGLSKGS